MAICMAVFLPYLVSDQSYITLYVPLVHGNIQYYSDTIVYLHFFRSAGLKKTFGG